MPHSDHPPTHAPRRTPEGGNAGLRLRVTFDVWQQQTYSPDRVALLRLDGARPRNRHAANERDELAPPHEHLPRKRTCSQRQ
jgi:hypothetical protein